MRSGEVITAEVIAIDSDHVTVNAGLKSESWIDAAEFKNAAGELEVAIGDFVTDSKREDPPEPEQQAAQHVASVPAGFHARPRQKTRPFGTGHHRNCTFPMMYFLGTKPQWRLSELLLRWSPITK